MGKSIRHEKIVPINWVDDEERWIVVPPTAAHGRRKGTREIVYVKGNCSFAVGIPKSIIDFIYRAVRQLNLTDRPLIFSRGTVRTSSGLMLRGVSIRELDWGVGTLIIIPRALKYRDMTAAAVEDETFSMRHMELAVLCGLLRLALPGKSSPYYAGVAARILVRGWSQLDAL